MNAGRRSRLRERGRTGAVIALALGVVMALSLAELTLRLAGISYPLLHSTDPCCGLTLRPGAAGWWTNEGRAYVAINRDGLRDVDHSRVRDSKRLRIAIMGDSYAEAKQVALEATFWSVAARELERCAALGSQGVEVINFGVSGYGTPQELRMYESRARSYAPDVVVLAFHSGNDLAENSNALDGNAMRPYYTLLDGALVLDDSFVRGREFVRRQGSMWQVSLAISSRSRLLQLVNELRVRHRHAARRADKRSRDAAVPGEELGLSRAIYLEPPPPPWEESWNVTDALIGRFSEQVERDGADFFVFGVSNGIQVHRDAAVRRAYAARLRVPDLDSPDRRLDAILTRRGIPHALSTPTLREQAERSGSCVHGFANAEPCGGHWNEAGHRAAGKLLARSLCQRLGTRTRDAGSGAMLKRARSIAGSCC